MSKRFKYTKAEIEKVIANLLVDEEKLGKWSSPKGVFPHRRDAVTLNFNTDEGWVVRDLARKSNKNIVEMMKYLIIHYYFNKFIKQDMLLKAENYVPIKTRMWLYGFAVRQLRKDGEQPPPRKLKRSKKDSLL